MWQLAAGAPAHGGNGKIKKLFDRTRVARPAEPTSHAVSVPLDGAAAKTYSAPPTDHETRRGLRKTKYSSLEVSEQF